MHMLLHKVTVFPGTYILQVVKKLCKQLVVWFCDLKLKAEQLHIQSCCPEMLSCYNGDILKKPNISFRDCLRIHTLIVADL